MNKWFITFTIVILIILITSVTAFKVIKEHNNKILLVESKYIVEKAISCVNQNICTGDKITLKTLYDNNIIDKQVNGVTNKYYNESSYVDIINEEFIIK